MKKGIILIIILFFFQLVTYSQNLENLDSKYRFNKFKLESTYQSYSKDLDFVLDDKSTGVKFYNYTKKDISIFGFTDIKQLVLGFYKNKLYNISITLGPTSDENTYKIILSKLKELFGYPTLVTSGSDKYGNEDYRTYMENVNQWVTNKTTLGLNKVKCNSIINPCSISIFLVSEKIGRQISNDGF